MWYWFCLRFLKYPLVCRVIIGTLISMIIHLTLEVGWGSFILAVAIAVVTFMTLDSLVLGTAIERLMKEKNLSRQEALSLISKGNL